MRHASEFAFGDAFYEVIAAAVVYIIGNLIIGVLTLQGTGNISTVQLIGWFPVLLITFVASNAQRNLRNAFRCSSVNTPATAIPVAWIAQNG